MNTNTDPRAIQDTDVCHYCGGTEELLAQPIKDANADYTIREVSCKECRRGSAEVEIQTDPADPLFPIQAVYAVVYRNNLLECQSVSFVSTDEKIADRYAAEHQAEYDEWKVIRVPAILDKVA